MATPITRAEFQKLYGYTPKQETPDIETKPAPMPISRAEYEAMYKLKPQTAGENFSSNVQQLGKAQQDVVTAGADTQTRIKERVASGEVSPVKGLFQRFGSGLATTADLAYEGAKGAVKMALPPQAEKSVSDFLSGYQGAIADRVKNDFETLKASPDPKDQEIAKQISDTIETYKTDETFRTDVNAAGGILNALFSAPVLSTASGIVEAGVKTVASNLPEPQTLVKTIRDTNRFTTTQDTAIANQAKDILKVEEKYQKSRNVNIKQGADADASRMRIAQSNVLDGAVDTNGLIDTTEAVKMYRAQNIDGYENTVKDILKNEGKTIDPRELRMDLRAGVLESGLEGATLLRALKGIDDHVRGLMVRSEDGRTIPLAAIQDAKVGEYKAINWQTKPNTATYKKTIARVYKEVIENNSDADIKSINNELAKYYTDIERLNDLNGKKVEGGRLGKYGAQVTGTVVGAGAGMLGGGAGAAIGGIVGGELASALKGRGMAQTFKRGIKGATPENAVLKQAKLKVPDKKVEAPKSITKTPEIKKVEKQIATNVNLQKKAIKENNYALVAELKDIYVSLVEKLKKLIEDYKKMTPREKQGGFIANPLAKKEMSKPSSNQDISYAKSNIKLTDAEIEAVDESLRNFDTTPLTVKQDGSTSVEMGNVDDMIRIDELKAIQETRPLSAKQTAEAKALLEKNGGLSNTAPTTLLEEVPKTVKVWKKSKFSDNGGYDDVKVIRREDNITLYQGGNGEKRQFWTPNKKYAEQFGNVKEKTGSFYKVDNGNRVTDVYVEVPNKSSSLLEEAKNYKSAEEFVKAQPKFYHGGGKIDSVSTRKSRFQNTFYFTESSDYAKSYGGKNSVVNEIYLDPSANLIDLRNPSEELVTAIADKLNGKETGKIIKINRPDGSVLEIPEIKGGASNPVYTNKQILQGIVDGKAMFIELPEVKKILKEMGYDGLVTTESNMGSNYGVWNGNKVKTRTEMEDLWNNS